MNGAPLSWPAGHSDLRAREWAGSLPAMGAWPLLLFFCFQVWGAPEAGRDPQPLHPNGENVCKSNSQPPVLSCCPGWTQEGEGCPLALCVGNDACRKGEVCVRPGLCRCRPGFFGFNCSARCPDQFWGPDCRQRCPCHPNGKCEPPSGQCLCLPGWWGPLCQAPCLCGAHGRCHPAMGACRCHPGWWAPDCSRPCLCNLAGSRCDPVTGRCLCHPGWWGRRCASFCNCHGAPCAQESGRCECREGQWGASCQHPCLCLRGSCAPHDGRCTCHPGYWGASCADPCPTGTYGPQCTNSCGHCSRPDACHPTDGTCLACAPGWNGTHCMQPCPPGRHGEKCAQRCPRCRQGEPCHPGTGECQACDAGLTGARCDLPCPAGRFGLGCRSFCPRCFNGSCDPVSGACLCQVGFWGSSCNQTCPGGFHGANCSETCQCLGGSCHPHSGECQWSQTQGPLLAGILAPLLLLLLLLLCLWGCFWQRRSKAMGTPNRAAAEAEGDLVSRAKGQRRGLLAGLTSALPCFSLGGYKLPRVTVSHHDVELPFSPSFIEPPSAVWPSDSFSSSFETDEDESPSPVGQGQPHDLRAEDPALDPDLFAIPRTSSMAKAKRPSVSFAEGTRFAPPILPGSVEILGSPQKSKTPCVAPEKQPATAGLRRQESPVTPSEGPCYENVEAAGGPLGGHVKARGSKKRPAGSRQVAQRVEVLEAALKSHHGQGPTTIYVTVGKAGTGGGTVQAALKRLGSLRRSKPPPREEAPIRQSLNGLQKLPRKARPAPEEEKEEEGREAAGLGTREAPECLRCLVDGLPAMVSCGEEEEGEVVRGLEADPCPKQAEKAAGGENPGPEEPKYENISDWRSLSPAPSPKEASSPLEKL